MPPTKKRQPPSMNPPKTSSTLKKPKHIMPPTKRTELHRNVWADITKHVKDVQLNLDPSYTDPANLRYSYLKEFLIYIYNSIKKNYPELSEEHIYYKWNEVILPYLKIIEWKDSGHAGSAEIWNNELKTLCNRIFPLAARLGQYSVFKVCTTKIKEFEYKKIFDLPYLPDFPSFQGGKKKTRKTNKKARKSHKKTKKAKRK